MNEAQIEAIANADAHVTNAGLPSYTSLFNAYKHLAVVQNKCEAHLREKVSQSLDKMALGDGFNGGALRDAQAIPGLGLEDVQVLARLSEGTEQTQDWTRLQEIAIKIRGRDVDPYIGYEWLSLMGHLLANYAEAVMFDSEDEIYEAATLIHNQALALLVEHMEIINQLVEFFNICAAQQPGEEALDRSGD